MNRVMNFARAHLGEGLELKALADVACLSKYHFSRVFAAHCGETPFAFLTRLRLECSVSRLIYHADQNITDVAFSCGYSSSQSFSRAFSDRFGIAPRRFRAANRWRAHSFPRNQLAQSGSQTRALLAEETDLTNLTVKIVNLPERELAYIRHLGPYFNVNGGIEATLARLESWARCQGLWREDSEIIGLCPNHPTVTPPTLCQYDVCMDVPRDLPEDAVVSRMKLPAGPYAMVALACSSLQLAAAWDWLSASWLPASGAKLAMRPSFEIYPAHKGRHGSPVTGIKLFLPIDRT